MIAITLQQILDADPCYDPITKHGLKGVDRNAPISFRKIVEVAGAQDAIWCFAMALPGHEALKRHYAVDCAERVRHLMDDPRSLSALEIARRHALGQALDEELALAQAAAWAAAARAAARADEAVWAAARADAWADEAVWAAARADEAVWAAAGADARADEAVWAAARAAAWAVAWADEAVWAAARAGEAVWAAAGADAKAGAAAAAAEAAEAEIRWQGQRLIEITEAGAWAPVGDESPKLRESPGELPNNNILR